MEPVIVVGAGIAGVACARELSVAGLPVRLLDRGHRPGGRMASRELDGRPVDLGASYLTVSDPGSGTDFAAVVEGWRAAGLAHPWTDTFTVLEGGRRPESKAGPMRWGTSAGTRSLVEHLAAGLDVTRADVRRVAVSGGRPTVDDVPAAAVVLAMPDPQARRLLEPGRVAERLDRVFEPVLALAARFARRTWDPASPDGRFEGAFVNGDSTAAVEWVADDGRRRGDDAPVLVAHSRPDVARWHVDHATSAEGEVLSALHRYLGIAAPTSTYAHLWTYAKPAGEREERFLLDGRLGVCGDGWGPSPKVETAWRSGRDLGRALAERLA